MKQLFKILPPFAPDYSGVCSALFELGGMSVILDASGCTSNYAGYDEPRWYGDAGRVFCSGVREIDAILGIEERLFIKIEEYLESNSASFVAILGSPVSMVIGTDYRTIALEVERRFGLPAFYFDTSGMHYYDRGASTVFLEIARRFVHPTKNRISGGVNIIGATPLDIGNFENLYALKALLKEQGYNIVSCWSMRSDLNTISKAASAELNVVISASGLDAARYLKNKYGIPYITGMPVGDKGTRILFDKIETELYGTLPKTALFPEGFNLSGALIIGEQIISNSIRDCLRLDFGIREVTVASYFIMDAEIAEPWDVKLESEKDLNIALESGQYSIVIADPLYRGFLPAVLKSTYIDLPHIAVSSKLFKHRLPVYVGKGGTNMLSRYLSGK